MSIKCEIIMTSARMIDAAGTFNFNLTNIGSLGLRRLIASFNARPRSGGSSPPPKEDSIGLVSLDLPNCMQFWEVRTGIVWFGDEIYRDDVGIVANSPSSFVNL